MVAAEAPEALEMRRLACTPARTAALVAERFETSATLGACALPILALLLTLFESALITILDRLVAAAGLTG